MLILNRRQFLKLLGAAAVAAGLPWETSQGESSQAESEPAIEETANIVALSAPEQPGLIITDISVEAVGSRPDFKGKSVQWVPDWDCQLWTIRGLRGYLQEEYQFFTLKEAVPPGRKAMLAFVEHKLSTLSPVSISYNL